MQRRGQQQQQQQQHQQQQQQQQNGGGGGGGGGMSSMGHGGGMGGMLGMGGGGGASHGQATGQMLQAGGLQYGGGMGGMPGGGGMGGMGGMGGGHPAGGSIEAMGTQAQAHYLLVLAHVMKCPSAHCTVPECAPTKALVTNHTRSCRAGDACTYPRCALSKRLMRHHRECPDQTCAICLPLRRRLAAAKVSVAAATAPNQQAQNANKRKAAKRKKEDEEADGAGAPGQGLPGDKKKRKGSDALANGQQVQADPRDHKKKRGSGAGVAVQPEPEPQMAVEHDLLEAGFSVTVHFPTGKRVSAAHFDPSMPGEWKHGTVMRSYIAPGQQQEVCYDIMMAEGREEKHVSHARCRMVCNVCLSDKRTFRPPPMFCEKCFTAIHQRWSYWEEVCAARRQTTEPRTRPSPRLATPNATTRSPLRSSPVPLTTPPLSYTPLPIPSPLSPFPLLSAGRRRGRAEAVQALLLRHQGLGAPQPSTV